MAKNAQSEKKFGEVAQEEMGNQDVFMSLETFVKVKKLSLGRTESFKIWIKINNLGNQHPERDWNRLYENFMNRRIVS